MQRARQCLVLRGGARAQAAQQIGVDLALGEGFQRQLATQLVHAQLLPQGLHRVVAQHQIGQPKAGHQHPSRRAATPRQVVEQADRGMVAPVQVLDHQQQRLRGGCCIEQRAKFAQHAVLRGTGQLAAQLHLVGLGDKPRQLRQPGGRGLAQRGHPRGRRWPPRQFGQRVEDGQVGFAATGLIDALAHRHGHPTRPRHGAGVADQAALADAGLAAHQHQLPLPGLRRREPRGELRAGLVAADQRDGFAARRRVVQRHDRCCLGHRSR